MLYLAFRLSKHLIDLSSGDDWKTFWQLEVTEKYWSGFFFIILQKSACIGSFPWCL